MPVRFYGGPLNALSEGFAAGAQGFAQNTLALRDRKRQAERDAENDRRYEEEKARAIEETNRAVANDVFRKNMLGRQQDRLEAKDALDLEQRKQAQEATSAIAAGAVTRGLPEGAMGPHDQQTEYSLEIARKLPPEMLNRFLAEQEQVALDSMYERTAEKHLSDWAKLKTLPSMEVLPNRAEEATVRADEYSKGIEEARAIKDPMQRREALKQALGMSKQALESSRGQFAEDMYRVQENQRLVGVHEPEIGQMEAELGVALQSIAKIDPDLAADFAARAYDHVSTKSKLLAALKAEALSGSEFKRLWYGMKTPSPGRPRQTQGAGGGKASTPQTYDDALLMARKILGDSTKVTEEQLRGLANEIWGRGVGARFDAQMDEMPNPITGPTPGALDLPFAESRPGGAANLQGSEQSGQPSKATPRPEQSGPLSKAALPLKFTEAPPETQKSVEEALRAAVAEKRRGDIRRIFAESNIDPDSITPETLNRILGATPERLESVKGRDYSLGGK